ncbi:MAG: TerD family protein [Oscillospiraceae bacterium]|nr:TerD family protein [Oscillospiraceae bacterium]
MAESINDILSRTPSGGTAVLPSGEYEGPVYITKPLRLVGSNTTIWAKRGSVIEITASGAVIEGLRVELTEGDPSENAIVSHAHTEVRDVELLGSCSGFGAEDMPFDFPKTINLGSFASDKTNTYKLKVNVPAAAEIECSTAGLSFSPTKLTAGMNEITITVGGLNSMTYLYAEVLIKSLFKRRIYVSGRPSADAQQVTDKLLYEAKEVTASVQTAPPPPATPADVITVNSPAPLYDMPVLDVRKGQRISLYQYTGNHCEIHFSAADMGGMEIDPYVFLLDSNEKAVGQRDLVFFGNEAAENDSVRYYPADGHLEIDFDKVDYRVQRMTLAYSIYEGGAGRNFSRVRSPKITISSGGTEKITYTMFGLSAELTVVAMEFYLYKGEWKVSAVGAGFRDGLVKLCNNYGIEVTD